MAGVLACVVAGSSVAAETELLIGAATTSITPDQPIALDGQFHTRVSQGVDNPITATAVAIEARRDGQRRGRQQPGRPGRRAGAGRPVRRVNQ